MYLLLDSKDEKDNLTPDNMADYNFATLNSLDFEHLVRDLLNAKLKAEGSETYFISFPSGRDKGIDLLDSESSNQAYNCIVQIKHNIGTSYQTFIHQLSRSTPSQKSELEKIGKLAPLRYILATSKPLTLGNKEDILNAMQPHIRSLSDIIDKEELNRLLTIYSEVEEQHPKLWFCSATVLNRILHKDVHERSAQLATDILHKFKLYVPIYNQDKALLILKQTRFLVIVGAPGCGKTSFAEMLIYKLVGNGFQEYYIDKSVKEVEKLLDDYTKQVFYFDDFLGHTRYEIEALRTNEKELLLFLRQLKQKQNKYFILTTRTSLINNAASESERFRQSTLFLEKQEIKLENIHQSTKLQIIKNHLATNEVPFEYINSLNQERLLQIAKHPNFSPRLIEFVTVPQNYLLVTPLKYFDYISTQLDNPHEVWLHAYEQQLNDYDRFLLTTLYSFGGAAQKQHLERAFEHRLFYETTYNNIKRTSNAFLHSMKKMVGSFLIFKQFFEGERLDFINPSLEDFLNHYLNASQAEKLRILHGALFIEQIYRRFRTSGMSCLVVTPSDIFRKKMQTEKLETIIEKGIGGQDSHLLVYKAIINHMFFKTSADVKTTLGFLDQVNWTAIMRVNELHLSGFLVSAADDSQLKPFVIDNFEPIMLTIFRLSETPQSIVYEKSLFAIFNQDYSVFISRPANQLLIKQHIDFFFADEIQATIEDLGENATDLQAVLDERDGLEKEIKDLYEEMGITQTVELMDFDALNWEVVCSENSFIEGMRKDDLARGPIRLDDDY
jgi:hypothetical protein